MTGDDLITRDLEVRNTGVVGASQHNPEKARLKMKGQGTIAFDFDCYLILCKGVSPILCVILSFNSLGKPSLTHSCLLDNESTRTQTRPTEKPVARLLTHSEMSSKTRFHPRTLIGTRTRLLSRQRNSHLLHQLRKDPSEYRLASFNAHYKYIC